MPLWGNQDNVMITGTVTVATANGNAVLGVGTAFLDNVRAGDYITIASRKYQVEQVNSNVQLFLTSNSATTSAGVRAFVQQGPKYIANVSVAENTYTIQNVYGVDRNEVGVPENIARGVHQTGWIHTFSYTDALGQLRNKTEVLVAMSKNFAANATGVLFGAGAGTDADDDNVLADYLLVFTQQPVNRSNTAGNSVVFTAVADSIPSGATLTYQWFRRDNANSTTFVAVLNSAGISGNTTNTLTITNVSNVAGNIFRLTVFGDGGADSNVSANATAILT
jgi:hypothetical protein